MDSDTIVSDSFKVTDDEVWSTEAIVDELTIALRDTKSFFCLINMSDVNVDALLRSLYESQAIYKMYRIPVFRPPPPFVIHLKHLDYHLKKELASLDKETLDYVIKEAIGRICEGIDKRYFLLSVKPLLRWRLER
jgi:DNA-binding transcriptional ArsR family regulator